MLEQHADALWTSHTLLNLGAGIRISRRMVVVRLPDGSLWLHSPNPPTDALREALGRLGPVAWLVAPNCFHHRFLRSWKAAYPDATLLAAPGLAAKRPDLQFDGELGEQPPAGWGGVLDPCLTEGAKKINEVVFFHRPSRTLILTDFAFNQSEASGLPALSRFVHRLARAYGRLGPSRLFRAMTDDPAVVKRCVERMLDRWPVERITVSHGEPIANDAARRLLDAYAAW